MTNRVDQAIADATNAVDKVTERWAGFLGDCKCECTDAGCPEHKGVSDCRTTATMILYRVDMIDVTGTAMCDNCAEDAMSTGLFTTETDVSSDETNDEHTEFINNDGWEDDNEWARR